MFRIQTNELPIFFIFFYTKRGCTFSWYSPNILFSHTPFKAELGKASLPYHGTLVYDAILKVEINIKSNEF